MSGQHRAVPGSTREARWPRRAPDTEWCLGRPVSHFAARTSTAPLRPSQVPRELSLEGPWDASNLVACPCECLFRAACICFEDWSPPGNIKSFTGPEVQPVILPYSPG